MKSLRGDLLKGLLAALGLGSLALVLVAYAVTRAEMNEVLDENLREVAEAVAQYHADALPAGAVRRPVRPPPERPAGQESPDDADLLTLVWRQDGTLLFSSSPRFMLRFSRLPGAARQQVAGEEWRTYTVVLGDTIVQAAQRTTARHQMAVEAASKLLLPLTLLALLLAGLLVVALRRGLRPWDDATAQIASRSAQSLAPMAGNDMPREMQPLVAAFNALMQRLSDAFAAQRRFVADAAHELRSPVTALRLQLQLLDRAPDAAARALASAELQLGIARSERLVEQLLQLSRAQPEVVHHTVEPVALDALVRAVVADHNREALARGMDLGAQAGVAGTVVGDPLQLRILLNNLVRNALHYTPPGSRVDVVATVLQGRPVLQVIDDGPGIPAAEQARVFDRFWRGSGAHVRQGDPSGSGLGLAIVQAIAHRHAASVGLYPGAHGVGLEVRVTFSGGHPPA